MLNFQGYEDKVGTKRQDNYQVEGREKTTIWGLAYGKIYLLPI